MKPSDVTEDIAVAATSIAAYGGLAQVHDWPLVCGIAGAVAAICTALTKQLQGQGQ